MATLAHGPNNNGIISGYVYYDANADGKPETTDWALYQSEVSLTNVITGASTDVYTNLDGSYEFTGLAAGTYTIAMVTPVTSPGAANLGALYDASGDPIAFEGLDENGHSVAAAGTASVNKISDLTLGAGYEAEWYSFGELVYPIALISKREFIGEGYMQFLPPTAVPVPPTWSPMTPEPGFLAMTLGAGLLMAWRFARPGRRQA
jgi:hypothetical protein